jgi:uncharacterized protein (TIGR03435 family)
MEHLTEARMRQGTSARFSSPKGRYMKAMARVLCVIRVAAVAGSAAGVLSAQTPARPAFEVASIKPSPPSTDQHIVAISQFQHGGGFTATNVHLRGLIMNAYNVTNARALGGPAWIDSDRFDVVAKGQEEASMNQIRLMLRALLEERFKLAVHTDVRELPVYRLVVARDDGRLGPRVRTAAIVDCVGEDLLPGGPAQARLIAPTDERPSCGVRVDGRVNLAAWGVTAVQLASTLSQFAGRPVQDRTGLAGRFDLNLEWSPDQRALRPPADDAQGISAPDDGVSIFTAMQEQLGLKLEPGKAPLEVLVIDRVEHPTED